MPNPGIDKGRITPEFMNALAEPLENVFTMIKHDICVKLAGAFNIGKIKIAVAPLPRPAGATSRCWHPKDAHRAAGTREASLRCVTASNAWRSYKLAQMGEFRRSTVSLIASYAQDIHKATKDAIEAAVRAGIDACEPELLKGNQRAYVTSKDVTVRRVSEMYEAQALDSCNMVNTVMLNSTLEYYKGITDELDGVMRDLAASQQELNAQTGAVVIGAKTLQEAVKDAVTNMTDHGITGFIDKAGRQWSPEAYVHMDIRTTTCNAAREASFERNKDYGNNLISVTAHAGARPLCYPYQGRVYSTDGTSGVTTDLSGAKIEYSPLSLTSYGQPAGLFGINCGHFNYPFVPGYSVVRGTPEPKEENDKHYALNQQQRAYERQIRGFKTQADALEAAGLTDEAKAMRSKARSATSNLKQWCADNGQDYYADRVRVTKSGNSLTNTATSGNMKSEPASLIFMHHADQFTSNAAKIQPIAGYEDVVVHGDKIGFEFRNADGKSENVSAQEFANILRDSSAYHGGAIRLISCETGADGATSAQTLADCLKVNVLAPSDLVWIAEDGSMNIGAEWNENTGKWILFKPRE